MDKDDYIQRDITILFQKRDQIQPIVKYILGSDFDKIDAGSRRKKIAEFCNTYRSIRSIGTLAQKNDRTRSNLLNKYTNTEEIKDYIHELIEQLTKKNDILNEFKFIFGSYFEHRFINNLEVIALLEKELDVQLKKIDEANFEKNESTQSYAINSEDIVSHLNLSNIKIKAFPEHILKLNDLKYLHLGHNQIESIPDEISELHVLESLVLRFNVIKQLPPPLFMLTRLKHIDFSFNRIKKISQDIGNLINIETLDLQSNHLESLPEKICDLTRLKELKLSNNKIMSLPTQMGALSALTSLFIQNNCLKQLPESFRRCRNLKILNLSDNQLKSIPNEMGEISSLEQLEIDNNQLTQLPSSFYRLTNLNYLSLKSNQINSVSSDIRAFRKLEILDFQNNRIRSLPDSIGQLTCLKKLYLNTNQLSDLPDTIDELEKLEDLDCSFNRITLFPEKVTHLSSLKTLSFAGNQITHINSSLLEMNELEELYLENNPFENIPLEIISKGKDNIFNWLREIKQGKTQKIFEAKLILVGEPGVGKTTFRKRLNHPNTEFNELNNGIDTTRGIDIDSYFFQTNSNNNDFKVNIWDFGGQSIYHATHQFFLTQRSFYLFMWEARSETEFTRFQYWLNMIKLLGGKSPVAVVMNKSDQRIFEINKKNWQKHFPQITEFFQISCKDKNDEEFQQLINHIKENIQKLPHVGNDWPDHWTQIRTEIESSDKNYMDYSKFKALCEPYGMKDEQIRKFSAYLHDLGVVLHFQEHPELDSIVIIKPEWGTRAVYRILDDMDTIKSQGVFTYDHLKTLWHDYPPEKYSSLLALMMKFELCFKIDHTNQYIVPQLLSPSEPDFVDDWPESSVRLELHYDFMPAGIIPRLIVHNNRRIKDKCYWRTGLVLKHDTSEALIKSDEIKHKIIIQITGSQHDNTFLRELIMDEMDDIHTQLNRPVVKLGVPCRCEECRNSPSSQYLYQYEKLKKRLNEKQQFILCGYSDNEVSIQRLIETGFDKTEHLSSIETQRTISVQIFISYSHEDSKQLDALILHLRSINKSIINKIWYDQKIRTGNNWRTDIQDAMNNSDVFIFLISPHSISSEFIEQHEIPTILKKKEMGSIFYPILIRECNWQSKEWIESSQIFSNEGSALWSDNQLSAPDGALTKIVQDIENRIKSNY
ncbi:MAG: leucine-rich repeat domain-containing protein [Candidatus Magnetomorum sp.]|nr:leucine-rich repeat domain-containing protein [Candidatus Magnetomorum sp.]